MGMCISNMPSIAIGDKKSIGYMPHSWSEMFTKDGELQSVLPETQQSFISQFRVQELPVGNPGGESPTDPDRPGEVLPGNGDG
jgi:hypothetical protein